MKVYKLTIFGVALFMMMQVGAKEYTQNTLPIPSVSSMSIEGETTVPVFHADTKTCELENFLVADRKATITVNMDEDYRPLWTDIIDAGIQIRHTIEKIEIIGMPLTKGKQAICFSFFLERTGEGEEYILSNVEDNSLWLWGISPKCRIGYNPVVSNRCYSFEVKFPRGLEHHGRYLWTANLVYTQETKYNWGEVMKLDLSWGSWVLNYEAQTLYHHYFVPDVLVPMGNLNADIFFDNAFQPISREDVLKTNLGCVFFSKYATDNKGLPNWFAYWKEDGACPALKEHEDEIICEIIRDKAKGYGRWEPEERKVYLCSYPIEDKGWSAAGIHYPTIGGCTYTNKNDTSMVFSFGGMDIYGIYAVEECLAHELQHKVTEDLYKGWHWFDKDSDAVDDYVYWGEFVMSDKEITFDRRREKMCDKIRDSEEDKSEYKLNKKDLDTYNVKYKHPMYEAYGDDEFLAMMAAKKASERTVEEGGADPSKDWAIPGEQSYLPEKVVWARSIYSLAQEATAAIFAPQPFTLNQCEPALVEYSEDGLVESLGVRFDVEAGTGGGGFVLAGIIYGMSGEAAASAFVLVDGQSNEVQLRFSGRDIRNSGVEGPYVVDTVALSEFNGVEMNECGTFSNLGLPVFEFTLADMDSPGASLRRNVTETVSTNGIELAVALDVVKAGDYSVVATLCTTGGVRIADAFGTCTCTAGVNQVTFSFDADRIYHSYEDGPYKIGYITLRGSEESIQSISDFYTLENDYGYENFERTVTFDSNGGWGYMPSQTFVGGVPFRLNGNVLYNAGFAFAGWATDPDGAVVYGDGAEVTFEFDVTLYAIWEVADTTPRPDIGFATFSNWDFGYSMFTTRYTNGDIFESAPVTVFDYGELFYIVHGYGNFGEGAIENSNVAVLRELVSESGATAFSEERNYTETLESYTGSQRAFNSPEWEDLRPGVYQAIVTLDSTDSIGDTNKDNNVSTFMFAIRDALSINDALGCTNLVFTTENDGWYGTRDGEYPNLSYARTRHLGLLGTNVLSTCVSEAGRLSFYWQVSSEEGCDWLEFLIDGKVQKRISGVNGGQCEFVVGDGSHTFMWRYAKDEMYYSNLDCAWLCNVIWTQRSDEPTIADDYYAKIYGDATNGFLLIPSSSYGIIEVSIPGGLEPEKVTVQVGTGVETVKANGANIKVVKGAHDITEYLQIPAADGDGVTDMTKAEVKQEVVDEALDEDKGAVVRLVDIEAPRIVTSATKPGLRYTLREGTQAADLQDGDSKEGDGEPWTPNISVTGGDSAFYTIKVEK